MQTYYLKIKQCRVCRKWPMWFSGMCRTCYQQFDNHNDLSTLDRFLDKFYPKAK